MNTNASERDLAAPLWPFLLFSAAAAAWLDLGTIHRHHHADSIVPILTSLYCWTPFYWETNRNGMLVPLLAVPWKNPLANLLVQDGLNLFCGLATLFLIPRYLLRNYLWPYAAILSAVTFLSFAPMSFCFSFLVDQPYAVSLFLGLAGLIWIERAPDSRWLLPRFLLALFFITLAHWVNVGTGLLLGLFVAGRFLLGRWVSANAQHIATKAEIIHSLVLLGIGFSLGLLWMQLARYQETAQGLRPLNLWLPGLALLAGNTWTALEPHYWGLTLMLLAAVGISVQAYLSWQRPCFTVPFSAAGVLLLTALVYAAFLSGLQWVERGCFRERYAIPSVVFLQSGLCVLATSPLVCMSGAKVRIGSYLLAPLVLVAAGYRYDLPSLSRVQSDLNLRLGLRTADVLEGDCTHIVGNYWVVWPAVFHANLVRHQQGHSEIIWGVSFRSDPLRDRIQQAMAGQVRVAIPRDDPDAEELLLEYAFPPLEEIERRSTIAIFRPTVARK